MKKRSNFTVRYAQNGIIVHPEPNYARGDNSEDGDTLVFNSMVEFEKWFERHSEGEEPGEALFEAEHIAIASARQMGKSAAWEHVKRTLEEDYFSKNPLDGLSASTIVEVENTPDPLEAARQLSYRYKGAK